MGVYNIMIVLCTYFGLDDGCPNCSAQTVTDACFLFIQCTVCQNTLVYFRDNNLAVRVHKPKETTYNSCAIRQI